MIYRASTILFCAIASTGVLAFAPSAAKHSARKTALASTDFDISIPYDATVELAYEASDKSMSYEDFNPDWLTRNFAELSHLVFRDLNHLHFWISFPLLLIGDVF